MGSECPSFSCSPRGSALDSSVYGYFKLLSSGSCHEPVHRRYRETELLLCNWWPCIPIFPLGIDQRFVGCSNFLVHTASIITGSHHLPHDDDMIAYWLTPLFCPPAPHPPNGTPPRFQHPATPIAHIAPDGLGIPLCPFIHEKIPGELHIRDGGSGEGSGCFDRIVCR